MSQRDMPKLWLLKGLQVPAKAERLTPGWETTE